MSRKAHGAAGYTVVTVYAERRHAGLHQAAYTVTTVYPTAVLEQPSPS